jgi:NADPH-dependent glutamate synthase beta subunit-like oxidoreductase/NAD(P)H-flavin reductase
MASSTLNLSFGLSFSDLYTDQGLTRIHHHFCQFLKDCQPDLANGYLESLARPSSLVSSEESVFLLELAPYVEAFLQKLFQISQEVALLEKSYQKYSSIFHCKRFFVQRLVSKAFSPETAQSFQGECLLEELNCYINESFSGDELLFASYVNQWMEDPNATAALEIAIKYAAWALYSIEGRKKHKSGTLFHLPRKLDFSQLLHAQISQESLQAYESDLTPRKGFDLTDTGISLQEAVDQAHYCLWCHQQGKDTCRKGFEDPTQGFKRNPLNVPLTGCPLDQKISEMNLLASQGLPIGALAMAIVDNPMLAATGHRICNDCMKACIFQKQDPVQIPSLETRLLQDVLHLPSGFEIYSLLTRWNPLNIKQPLPSSPTNHKVLIVGMGPSGFTLSHYLLNAGHTVVGIDGLKIEPLPTALVEKDETGNPLFQPIHSIEALYENLGERQMSGFGGVAEYGITVRWDKNFLKIIRLLLERRAYFSLYGGIRMGGTLTFEQAFDLGFDHIALCVGAGKPNLLPLKNGLAPGVRQAVDFLMALQLTGAAKHDSLANLTLRLPIVVVGGGLTAIDTATEALAYYPLQVEKFLTRYTLLKEVYGKKAVEKFWTPQDHEIAHEFLSHGEALRQAATPVEKLKLLQKWGGVTVLYRQDIRQAPSYRINDDEIQKAIEQGVYIQENVSPHEVMVDPYGYASGLLCDHKETGEQTHFPAKTILMAIGTNPNTALAREYPDFLKTDNEFLKAFNAEGNSTTPSPLPKPPSPSILTAFYKEGKGVSFFGDLHPSYTGSVVKAMASAKYGAPLVSQFLQKSKPSSPTNQFLRTLKNQFLAHIMSVARVGECLLKIRIKAPLAAKNFKPGHFYRLQNYEAFALYVNNTILATEGIALRAMEQEEDVLSFMVSESGGSTRLCSLFKKDDPVILMGPTGSSSSLPFQKKVLLLGSENDFNFIAIAKALKANQNHVLALIENTSDSTFLIQPLRFYVDNLVICGKPSPLEPSASPLVYFEGTVFDALQAYHQGTLIHDFALYDINLVMVGGNPSFAKKMAEVYKTSFQKSMNPDSKAVSMVNAPMQCMMKEICGQCLQILHDPILNISSFVFACAESEQNLETIDFDFLQKRLSQNSLQEKLTDLWVKHCLKEVHTSS